MGHGSTPILVSSFTMLYYFREITPQGSSWEIDLWIA